MKTQFVRSLTSHQATSILALLKCMKKLGIKPYTRFQFLQRGMTNPGCPTEYKVNIE